MVFLSRLLHGACRGSGAPKVGRLTECGAEGCAVRGLTELHSSEGCEPGEALFKVERLGRAVKVQPQRLQPLKQEHL